MLIALILESSEGILVWRIGTILKYLIKVTSVSYTHLTLPTILLV